MLPLQEILFFSAVFFIVSLASEQFGKWFSRFKLPLITGFLFTGIVAGPYVLDIIPKKAVVSLRFIDEIALAFIAFAAGCELVIKEMKGTFKSIRWVTVCQVIATFSIGSIATYFLTENLSFAQNLSDAGKLSIAVLAGSILVARSPSSAIAVIKELRARGTFTQTTLAITVVTDVVVIVLFSISFSFAVGLLTGSEMDLGFLGTLALELAVSPLIGWTLAKILCFLLSLKKVRMMTKTLIILALGYGVFIFSGFLTHLADEYLSIHLRPEPLLICMTGAFIVTNFSDYRDELANCLHRIGPLIYVAFFTLTGASLTLSILAQIWPVTLVLFGVRVASIFLGSFSGGVIAKADSLHNKTSWMAYITQAGVGLGLAKQVGVFFPEWGAEFATMMISVIVVNQIVGPPLFKWSLFKVGEAHPKAKKSDESISHYAIICGAGGQAIALARQLYNHGWKVAVAYKEMEAATEDVKLECEIKQVEAFSLEELQELDARNAGAVVTMLTDDENLAICETVYENFGMANLVVNVNNSTNLERFKELGAFVVMRPTAIISLLDHYVRTPSAVSLLMGDEEEHDVTNIEVKNPDLSGVSLKEIKFPNDIIFLCVRRKSKSLNVHNYYRFREGDTITMAGSKKSLDIMASFLDVNGWALAAEKHGFF